MMHNIMQNTNSWNTLTVAQWEKLLIELKQQLPEIKIIDGMMLSVMSFEKTPLPAQVATLARIWDASTEKKKYFASPDASPISYANNMIQQRWNNSPDITEKIELIAYVEDFEDKIRTSWIPTKDDIFKYGKSLLALGKPYSPPNKWAKEFYGIKL